MMTAPVYQTMQNDRRLKAQNKLRAAFANHGERCTCVDGHTPATRVAIEVQAHYFRKYDSGKVEDPYHANKYVGAVFLKLRIAPMCNVLIKQFKAITTAGSRAS